MLNCEGSCTECPGNNSKRLAEIICAAVLAGELSLMAALCTDDLVKNHLKYNRYVLYLTLVKFVYSLIKFVLVSFLANLILHFLCFNT